MTETPTAEQIRAAIEEMLRRKYGITLMPAPKPVPGGKR